MNVVLKNNSTIDCQACGRPLYRALKDYKAHEKLLAEYIEDLSSNKPLLGGQLIKCGRCGFQQHQNYIYNPKNWKQNDN